MTRLPCLSTAAPWLGPDRHQTLLHNARARNETEEVTGILLFHKNGFLQVVEGPTEAISGLWDRLLRDPRHHNISPPFRTRVNSRLFPDWPMACAWPDRFCAETPPGLVGCDALREDLARIERQDRRAALFLKRVFASFRELAHLSRI